MVGRRQMADGGFHQGHGSKEETGAVDPSRDQRRRGSSRIAARRSRKTQATGSAACSNNTASAGYRTCADAHRDPDGSACRVGIVFTSYSATVARRPGPSRQRSADSETWPGRRHLRGGSPKESLDFRLGQSGYSGRFSNKHANDVRVIRGSARKPGPADSRHLGSSPVRLAALQLQNDCARRRTVSQKDAGDGRRRNPSPCCTADARRRCGKTRSSFFAPKQSDRS